MFDDDDNEFQDSFQEQPSRTCDRCGASGDDRSKPDPLCMEVQLAFGLVSWLCHPCRKDWHRMFKTHELQDQYAEASLRLEFWKARVGTNTPDDAIDEGLKLYKDVNDLELAINEAANQWMVGDLDQVRSL